jgi:AcrR family transcriptional regulator
MVETSPGATASRTTTRRVPVQRRSRERVERILDAAAELVIDDGVARLTTLAVAARSGVPAASIYQYFADRDEIVLALVERDVAEMDARVAQALAALRTPSVRAVVEATMRAFVSVYHHRPSFVVIWWRGRTNAAVVEFCRAHNRHMAMLLYEFASAAGLLRPGTSPRIVELAVEVGDRVFEMAFAHDLRGDEALINEGIDLLTGYLERHATPADDRQPHTGSTMVGVPVDMADPAGVSSPERRFTPNVTNWSDS